MRCIGLGVVATPNQLWEMASKKRFEVGKAYTNNPDTQFYDAKILLVSKSL
jgi:hypothetical protein